MSYHSVSLVLFGDIALQGEGVVKSPETALQLIKEAADKGSVDAQFKLGLIYLSGDLVKQNRIEALHWLNIAAKQGHPQV